MSRHALAGVLCSLVILAGPGSLVRTGCGGPVGPLGRSHPGSGAGARRRCRSLRTADKWEGAIGIPTQGLKAFPLAEILVKNSSVSFAMKGVPGEPRFRGTLSPDAKSLSG